MISLADLWELINLVISVGVVVVFLALISGPQMDFAYDYHGATTTGNGE